MSAVDKVRSFAESRSGDHEIIRDGFIYRDARELLSILAPAPLQQPVRLRLGRPLTLADLEAHHDFAGAWLAPTVSNEWIEVSGHILKHCLSAGPVRDGIPLDEDGQPCPIGGWGVSR